MYFPFSLLFDFHVTLITIVLLQASHTIDLLPFILCSCLQFSRHYLLAQLLTRERHNSKFDVFQLSDKRCRHNYVTFVLGL
jgi:hypothetical protein